MCRFALIVQSGYLFLKLLAGTYEGGYTYVIEMRCYRTLDIVLYIFLLCASKRQMHYGMYSTFYVPQTSVVRFRLAYLLEHKYDG
jgi:hypothetical protein